MLSLLLWTLVSHSAGATSTVTIFPKSLGSTATTGATKGGTLQTWEYDTACGTYDNSAEYSKGCPGSNGAVSFSSGAVLVESFVGKEHAATTDTFTVTIRHDVEGSYQLRDRGDFYRGVTLKSGGRDLYPQKDNDKPYYTLAVTNDENKTVYTFTATNSAVGGAKSISALAAPSATTQVQYLGTDGAGNAFAAETLGCTDGAVFFTSGANFQKIGKDLPAGAVSVLSSTGDTAAVNSTKRSSNFGNFDAATVELTTTAGRGIGNITWKWTQPVSVSLEKGVLDTVAPNRYNAAEWDGIVQLPLGYVKFEHGAHCYGYKAGGTQHENRVYLDSVQSRDFPKSASNYGTFNNMGQLTAGVGLPFVGFSSIASGDKMVVTCDGARNPLSMPVNLTVGVFALLKNTLKTGIDYDCASNTDDEGASTTSDGKQATVSTVRNFGAWSKYVKYVNFPAISQYTFSAASTLEAGAVAMLLLCFTSFFY